MGTMDRMECCIYGYVGSSQIKPPQKNIYMWLKDLGESLCAAISPRQTTEAAFYITNYFLSPTISLHKKYRCTTELICGLAQRKATSAFGHLTSPKICHFTVISQQQLYSSYQKNSIMSILPACRVQTQCLQTHQFPNLR